MKALRLFLSSVALTLIAGGLVSCNKKTVTAATPELVRDVRVVQSTEQKIPEMVESVGTVRALESSTLSAQVMGTVSSVAVREGDHVRSGQVLVTISASQLQSDAQRAHAAVFASGQQEAAAETESKLAATTLQRYEMLKAQKSVSPQEFDEVAARAQAASAKLAAARSQEAEAKAAESAAHTMQGYTRIRAPFDGVVTARMVDPGAMAAPGVPLLTVEKAGPLHLETSVDESLLASLRAGAALPVVIDSMSDTPIEGKVSQIVPAADPASRSFLVKILLPALSDLHSGMSGHALIERGTRTAVLIPASAIVKHGSMQGLYVVGPNQVAMLRYITVGQRFGSQVEILSGLSSGEPLIDSPGERELSGKRIEVRQ